MQTPMLKWGIVLIIALIAVWVWSWVSLASAGAKEVKPKAPVPETGQTSSSAPGDDGEKRAGVAWPVPRFTDRGNGTVRDNLTGLIWLQQANCFVFRTWAQALTDANTLASPSCGLLDGSVAGDWRLPNVRELLSLIDYGFILPALSNAAGTSQCTAADCAFSGVQSVGGADGYWSSTPLDFPAAIWFVIMGDGKNNATGHDAPFHVWPVRGGGIAA